MVAENAKNPSHEATLPTQSEFADEGVASGVPALSILYHPDYQRIGERALLGNLVDGDALHLSRMSPLFAQPGSDTAAPLADPYVSASKPLHMRLTWPHGIELWPAPGARVTIGRQPLQASLVLPVSALRQGIILALNKRVLLLLHMIANTGQDLDSMGLVGHSDGIQAVRRAILNVADLDVPVLIRGETGVGKEHVAHAIHRSGKRDKAAFIAVNMAAINRETAVSELFGHTRGAFTGAHSPKPGLFEHADGGTLFLDEIGDAPDAVQTMLLRVLQTGEIRRMGDSSQRAVDVRIVAATDANLERAIQQGGFRSALLHRLSSYRISVPPLRDRIDDMARLTLHFLRIELERIGELHRLQPLPPKQRPWLSPSIMLRLLEHPWPGNVRELANVVRQLLISNRNAPWLTLSPDMLMAPGYSSSLHAHASNDGPSTRPPPMTPVPSSQPASVLPSNLRSPPGSQLSDDELIEALREHGFAVKATARTLGMAPSTLYDRIDKSGRLRAAKDIPRDELLQCLAACDNDIRRMADRLMVSERALRMRLRELDLQGAEKGRSRP